MASVSDDDIFALIAAERRRAADMFAVLDDAQWQTKSLCSEWTVREVAAHLIGPFCVSVPKFVLGAIMAGSFHRYSVRASQTLPSGRRRRSSRSCALTQTAGSPRPEPA
jgi:hypothetical protein